MHEDIRCTPLEKALDNDKLRAEYILTQIQRLYQIERKAREKNIDRCTPL